MVRNRKRKTDIGLHNENDMRKAIAEVEKGMSLRKAAERNNVNYGTLFRYVKKKKNCAEGQLSDLRLTPNYSNRLVFSSSQEAALKEHLVTCSKMCYGLDTVECRKLAYELAVSHNLNIPESWARRQAAGIDWLHGFRKRNPDMSLRKPEACSLSRATAFNRHNVNIFYDNLEEVMQRNQNFANGTRLFCLDETGTTTVQKPKKIIACKGVKQLNKVTSAERGTLVTTCCVVSATGSALPPAMVFPRVKFQSFMLNGAPPGTLGLAQPTGWMNCALFPQVMRHFVKLTASSKENPFLLILDNHDSHLAPEALNIAKENGVTILTIPPHSSHKLQPLDVSMFGPLQSYYNAAADSWMMRHPGKTISMYDIAALLTQAFDKALTPTNIKSGFKKTGIFPFDRHIFNNDDFMPSQVTNRPLEDPQPPPSIDQSGLDHSVKQGNSIQDPGPSTSQASAKLGIESDDILVSPIGCRNYPKAGPRITSNKSRKRGKSCIATDTPIKTEFEDAARKRDEKKKEQEEKKRKRNERQAEKVQKITKVLFDSPEKNSSGEESDLESISSDSSYENLPLKFHKTPRKDDFVIVRFKGKHCSVKHYIGKLLTDKENNEYDISYLRKSVKVDYIFYFPLEPDLATVILEDIEMILPPPTMTNKTKRQADCYTFPNKIIRKYNLV